MGLLVGPPTPPSRVPQGSGWLWRACGTLRPSSSSERSQRKGCAAGPPPAVPPHVPGEGGALAAAVPTDLTPADGGGWGTQKGTGRGWQEQVTIIGIPHCNIM